MEKADLDDTSLASTNDVYHGQYMQDKYLNEHVFKQRRNGVFVEIGAYDGIGLSNTYFFESELNWNGICVEPMANIFKRLRSNRKCKCLNKCVSDHSDKASFLHVIRNKKSTKLKVNNTNHQLQTYIGDDSFTSGCMLEPFTLKGKNRIDMVSGLLEFYNPKHLEIINKELDELGVQKIIFESSCISINELLSLLPGNKIDYLSIDTEGSEFHILKAIDFSRFTIDVISLEVLSSNTELPEFMEQNGYKLLKRLGCDLVYKNA